MSTSIRPMHGGSRMPVPSRSSRETPSPWAPTIVRLRLNRRPGAFVRLEFGPPWAEWGDGWQCGGVFMRLGRVRWVVAEEEEEEGKGRGWSQCGGGEEVGFGGEEGGGGCHSGGDGGVGGGESGVEQAGTRSSQAVPILPCSGRHCWAPYIATGLLEALAAATGMAAGAILSGASIPILSQTFLIWQILLSVIFLGRRYRVNQLIGCFLVAVGVVITLWSGSGAGHSLRDAGLFWSLMMIVSFLLQAAVAVLKEVIFLDFSQKKGGSVDLFVVNSYGSAFQALFISLMLPFLSKMWGVPFSQLPSYIRDGTACFLNIGSLSSGCEDLFCHGLLSRLHVFSSHIRLHLHATLTVAGRRFLPTARIHFGGNSSSNRIACVLLLSILGVFQTSIFFCWLEGDDDKECTLPALAEATRCGFRTLAD
ncbi:hypothetical protein MLD38_004165 [Melastoma candidum]|uniref:Uncharacterized protein n=1 Tax=Melastoma candidum TaxID=119954 RepID=A0ACB9S6D0_9MYRT|nr:hypothetical protein MLD38_004165 [Melastoma candidum]